MFSAVIFWAIAGILLIGSEMIIPGFTIFFFGLGALLTSALTAIIPGLENNIAIQVLIWAASSITSFAFLRKYLAKIFKGRLIDDHSGEDDDSGKLATVIRPISPEKPGRIRYHGTSWKAISYDQSFEPGEKVEILKQEGLSYIVSGIMPGTEIPDNLDLEE